VILSCCQTSFREQKPPQCPKVVEDSPTGGDVQIQFRQIKRNQEKRLFAPVGTFTLGDRNFSVNITPGFVEGFGQESNILVGPLDTVKWRFGLVAHKHAFPTSLRSRAVALPEIKCSSFSHKSYKTVSRILGRFDTN
jgi:hypothetical protein